MSRKLRFLIAVLSAVGWLSFPAPGQGQEGLEYSLRSETGLAGAFLDPQHKRPVWFTASAEGGMTILRIDLYEQSVTVRRGQGELHINSSNNTDRGFSTLSAEERGVLQRLATSIDQGLEARSAFDESVLCTIRSLSSWPADMPLSVSVDPVTKTIGGISVPMEEIREARRQALDDLHVQFPGGEEETAAEAYTSLCNQIGRTRLACYPTSLVPYKERCEKVLVGGTTCRGRCGTTCNGLCSQQRYTQDCHSHDRCADVYGIAHRYCNYIFNSTFDDCSRAPDCVDLPGVWTFNYTWNGYQPGSAPVSILPNRKFTTVGSAGTWTATDTSAKLTFTSGGCKPIYTGTLSANRQTASGTMRCTIGSNTGTWNASKTNSVLSAQGTLQSDEPAPASEDRGLLSGPPD